MSGFSVGVDFGTSTTAAVLRWPDGSVRPLIIDGSELMPSAVCRDPSGVLLAGRDALHAGRSFPDALEPNPKRCVDDGTVLLGDAEVPVVDLFAAVLRRVADEARRAAGQPLSTATITCPVGWGTSRRRVLLAAADAAGLSPAGLAREPVAAAMRFLQAADLRIGGRLLVYDLGAGTFDASLVRRTPDGFDVIAERGLPDAGGLDIDAVIAGHLGTAYAARDPDRWRRLVRPTTDPDRRAAQQFRADVRTAKEMLSRTASTTVPVALFDDTAPLGREQLDRLAGPILERTVATARAVLADAGVNRPDAVFLVGGASRTPLAATLLHRAFGVAPTVLDRPELVVAEGSVDAATLTDPDPDPDPDPSRTPPAEPVSSTEEVALTPSPQIADRNHRGRRAVLAAGGATMLAGAVAGWRFLRADRPGRARAVDPPFLAGATLRAHTDEVQALAFSRDGNTLASTGLDRTIRVWNAKTGRLVRTLGGDSTNHGLNLIAVSPDGGRVAVPWTGAAPPTQQVWEVATDRVVTLHGLGEAPTALRFSPDGTTLVSTHRDGRIRLWNPAETGLPVATVSTGHELTWRVEFSRDGHWLVTGSSTLTQYEPDRGAVQVWSLTSRIVLNTFDGYRDGAISPDGSILALTALDGALHRCDLYTGRIAPLATDRIGDFATFVTNTLLLQSPQVGNGRPRLWSLPAGRVLGELPDEAPFAVRPDGGVVAAVDRDDDSNIRLWTVAT